MVNDTISLDVSIFFNKTSKVDQVESQKTYMFKISQGACTGASWNFRKALLTCQILEVAMGKPFDFYSDRVFPTQKFYLQQNRKQDGSI